MVNLQSAKTLPRDGERLGCQRREDVNIEDVSSISDNVISESDGTIAPIPTARITWNTETSVGGAMRSTSLHKIL